MTSDTPSQPLVVGIALVEHNGCYLIGRRAAQGPLPGYWEFPGGKCRPDETPGACAARECREETGLQIEVLRLRRRVQHCYEHGLVDLHFFDCRLCTPANAADFPRDPFRWVRREELANDRFPEANAQIVQELALHGTSHERP